MNKLRHIFSALLNGRRRAIILSLLVYLQTNGQEYPQREWMYNKSLLPAGWDSTRLEALMKYITDSSYITGLMIVQHGRIAFEYGDIKEVSYIASCRKSILSIIYGPWVTSGKIDLQQNLQSLGINDTGGLLPQEKEATIADIISARSGVFHPASYAGDYLNLAPKRGSVRHGVYWLYSNWDFNVAGAIFEKKTGRNIYDEIERLLAKPLNMQDWQCNLQQKEGDSTRSWYPAYPMHFSTRDMARIGLLMLNNGKWNHKQLIDSSWIGQMIVPRTSFKEVSDHVPALAALPVQLGYGYMWWLWQNVSDSRLAGAYSALGSLGQSISIFPAIGVVIAYKTKAIYGRENSLWVRLNVLKMAVECYHTN